MLGKVTRRKFVLDFDVVTLPFFRAAAALFPAQRATTEAVDTLAAAVDQIRGRAKDSTRSYVAAYLRASFSQRKFSEESFAAAADDRARKD
jgi:hypothetical protein